MSNGMAHGDDAVASNPSAPQSFSTFWAIIGVIGLVGLIVPEIVIVGVAFVWAMDGLMHLGTTVTAVLAAIVAVPVLWASLEVVKAAVRLEFGGNAG